MFAEALVAVAVCGGLAAATAGRGEREILVYVTVLGMLGVALLWAVASFAEEPSVPLSVLIEQRQKYDEAIPQLQGARDALDLLIRIAQQTPTPQAETPTAILGCPVPTP